MGMICSHSRQVMFFDAVVFRLLRFARNDGGIPRNDGYKTKPLCHGETSPSL